MSVLAIMTTRNEVGYIEHSLQRFIDDGIELVLIDNGSVDGTRELAERHLGRGLLRIEDLPWTGTYDLERLLRAKDDVAASARHDWIVSADADEWLRSWDEATLAEFLRHDVAPRSLVVDFLEFVFVPPLGVDMHGNDVRSLATSYYHFAPSPMRLMRAWRRGSMGSLVDGAGHRFASATPDVIHPVPQVMRHYIGLSWSHAIEKRADRTYSRSSLDRGWHGNRLDLRNARPFQAHPALRHAVPWWTRQLDASLPMRHHFWEDRFWSDVATAGDRTA